MHRFDRSRSARTVARSLSAAAVLAAAVVTAVPSTALAADKNWIGSGSGTWSTSGNWSPNGAPTAGDNVFLGDQFLIVDRQVYLNVNPIVASLSLTNGTFFDTREHSVQVSGTTEIKDFIGNWSRIMLRNGVNAFDLHTQDLVITGGSDIWAVDNPTIFVTGQATFGVNSGIFGSAVLNFTGDTGPVLVMDGNFTANAASSWTLNQLGAGKIDLDGTQIADNNILLLGAGAATQSFSVNGTTLHDAFDDSFWLGTGSALNMNLSEGWQLGANGSIQIYARPPATPATINGGTLTVSGTIEFDDSFLSIAESHAAINAPVIFNLASDVIVGGRDTLDVNGPATITGGRFTLGGTAGNTLNFNGPTKISGGTFTTEDDQAFPSEVRFNAATEWSGTVTVNGTVRQIGPATVNNPTVINGGRIDMDGLLAEGKWDVNSTLTINADKLDLDDNIMSGTIDVSSSIFFPAALTVNLPAGQSWVAGGRLNLTGSGLGTSTTLSGSDVAIGGEAFVTRANAIAAKVKFDLGSVTTINVDSALWLNGGSLGNPNTMAGGRINGPGALRMADGHALVGSGTISAPVDFDGNAELMARDGVLTVAGAVADVGVIGTANANSTLNLPQSFNTNVAEAMELNGGTVTGLTLINGGQIVGRGFIATTFFNNSGTLTANGLGTISINTGFVPDLDGSTEAGVVNAIDGSVHVQEQISDAFNGEINLREPRTFRIDGPWILAAGGTLNAIASPSGAALARVIANSQNIAGAVNIQTNTTLGMSSLTTFAPTAVVTLDTAQSRMELLGNATISAGATFVTPSFVPGELFVHPDMTLEMAHNAVADVELLNDGTLRLNGAQPGKATFARLFQASTGKTQIDLHGATPGSGHDQIVLTDIAGYRGTLALQTGAGYDPQYLVPHTVIDGIGTPAQPFELITGMIVSPVKYLAVTYSAGGDVRVTAAIPGDANLDGTVGIADFAVLASGFNGTGTWANGNFNGDAGVDIGDFSLLATHFNASIPSSLMRPGQEMMMSFAAARASAVPEPAAAAVAAGVTMAGTLLGRRRRRLEMM